jgi:membrane-bound lytic murein transglycosylase D
MVFGSNSRLRCILPALLIFTGLPALSQQINFQTSLFSAAPLKVVPPNSNAQKQASEAQELATRISQRRNSFDALVQRAEGRFQQGRRLYQAKDASGARKEFDAAIDLMLEAGQDAADRQAWEKRFDEMVDAIHRYDLAGLGAAVPTEDAGYEKAPLEDILEMTFPTDPKLKLQVREQLMATVSQLPLTINDQVLGYIRYFSTAKGRATLMGGLRRAGRYRPLIQRILDEEGLPQELIHLAQAESGFLPRAVSRKAAGGMWQFIRERGREYGLTQNALIDERFDPEKATRAAARHLRDLYQQFGDWYLAVAAYNCGPVAVDRAVQRSGYADFWVLRQRRLLPAETTNYVPIILAFTIMTKNAEAYGLTDITPDDPLEYDTVEMTVPTHLALAGDLTDAPAAELAALNPSLLKSIAPAGYLLRVPKGSGQALMMALQLVPSERRASWRMHKFEDGETLAAIGKRYGAAPASIVAANQMKSFEPEPGDHIVIPAVERKAPTRVARSKSASRATSTRRARTQPAVSKPVKKPAPVLTRTASAARPRPAL